MDLKKQFKEGLLIKNPVLVQLLACPLQSS